MDHAVPDSPTLTSKHTFIRSYQACVPCRKRKVKCDLGDPGNPSDPPCRRCRREHKDCFFQDLRTKKGEAAKATETGRVAKRSRSHTKVEEGSPTPPTASTAPLSHLGDLFTHTAATNPLGPPNHSSNDSATADRILHKEVHNANEALNLLFEAAAESRSESDDGRNAHTQFETQFSERDDPNTIAWHKFWCVKAGWMTAIEARRFVDLYLFTCTS